MRSNPETATIQETEQKKPSPKIAINEETSDSFPIHTVLSGMALAENRRSVLESQIGDTVSIFHSEESDYSNTFCVVNNRTRATLGRIALKLGIRFMETYGKTARFVGEIIDIQSEKNVVCEILILDIVTEK